MDSSVDAFCYLINYSIVFSWVTLSVVTDPWKQLERSCCKQRRRDSHNPLMYGRAAVEKKKRNWNFRQYVILYTYKKLLLDVMWQKLIRAN